MGEPWLTETPWTKLSGKERAYFLSFNSYKQGVIAQTLSTGTEAAKTTNEGSSPWDCNFLNGKPDQGPQAHWDEACILNQLQQRKCPPGMPPGQWGKSNILIKVSQVCLWNNWDYLRRFYLLVFETESPVALSQLGCHQIQYQRFHFTKWRLRS